MLGRRRTIARWVTTLLVAAGIACGATVALLAAGCGSSTSGPGPGAPPDQTGVILAVTPGGGDTIATLLIGPPSTTGEASVRVTHDTAWLRGSLPMAAPPLDDRLLGRKVAVKFTGPVAESFPVQATAAWIRLLPVTAYGITGRTLVTGGLLTTPHTEANELVAIHWGDEGGPTVATITSDATGVFSVDLYPGDYTLVTLPDDDKMPGSATVHVKAGDYAHVRLIESVR